MAGDNYLDYYNGRQVMITGGLGFLGSNLAIRLVELGAKLLLVDAMLPLYGGNLYNVESVKDKVTVNIADIRDAGAMAHLVQGQEVIFHIGNQTSHLDSMTDPLLDADINCRGNLIFLEAVRQHAPEARVVYAGSRAQYGKPVRIPVRETDATYPVDIYGANKHAAEQYHMIYHHAHGLWATSLRISNTYGARHQMKHARYGILNWFIRLALDARPLTVYGTGQQLRDYNYVDDVTDAFLRAAATDKANGEAYNLGSDQSEQMSFASLIEKVAMLAATGAELVSVPWPDERKAIETGDFVADCDKAKRDLGWHPAVKLDDGLRRTIDFYRQHKEHYW